MTEIIDSKQEGNITFLKLVVNHPNQNNHTLKSCYYLEELETNGFVLGKVNFTVAVFGSRKTALKWIKEEFAKHFYKNNL